MGVAEWPPTRQSFPAEIYHNNSDSALSVNNFINTQITNTQDGTVQIDQNAVLTR